MRTMAIRVSSGMVVVVKSANILLIACPRIRVLWGMKDERVYHAP